MRIVEWNVQGNVDALAARSDVSGADIYLLNETPPDLKLEGRFMKAAERTIALDCPHAVGECTCRRRWSAAVASPHPLEAITDARISKGGRVLAFGPSRPGTWVAATAKMPEGEELTAISLYGLMGGEKTDESVHRSLSELSPIFDHERYGTLLVLGGDLNTLARHPLGSRRLAKDQGVLDRITDGFGLVDLLKRDVLEAGRGPLDGCHCGYEEGCTHTWTHKHVGHETTPYQDDYLFASPELARRLTRSCVLGFTDASDHAPILAYSEPSRAEAGHHVP